MIEVKKSTGLRETRLLDSEELPIKALRKRLTISFVSISLFIYLITIALAILVSSSSLNLSLDSNIKRLIAEIQPAVKIENGHLSLRDWETNARSQNLQIQHVVQLYDKDGKLLEAYGISGVPRLTDGRCEQAGLQFAHDFRSKFIAVQNAGFLQIQVDAKRTDEALIHFLMTMLALIPVVALTAGWAGYIFCGEAVMPISENFRVLRRFVDDAGHELRTPVSIISASVETLEVVLASDDANVRIVEKINRAVARLKYLSSNLLILATMDSPGMQLRYSTLDLTALVLQVCSDFQSAAANKGIKLQVSVRPNLELLGNSDALQQMLSNLLDNAIRCTANGGTISVNGQSNATTTSIEVSDSGIGIPEESIQHVFERFYRVESSRAREQGGTGLGLSIVKSVVEAHGGKVSVSSKLNVGTVFTAQFPHRT
ncbi:MAG TPA: ATP-binding protein [Planktothrix sp.]|jgi:signal transduction histidine kinase